MSHGREERKGAEGEAQVLRNEDRGLGRGYLLMEDTVFIRSTKAPDDKL